MTGRDHRVDLELIVDPAPAGPVTLKGTFSTLDGPLSWVIDSHSESDPSLVIDEQSSVRVDRRIYRVPRPVRQR